MLIGSVEHHDFPVMPVGISKTNDFPGHQLTHGPGISQAGSQRTQGVVQPVIQRCLGRQAGDGVGIVDMAEVRHRFQALQGLGGEGAGHAVRVELWVGIFQLRRVDQS
ncbi:hypothetical protein D3C78_1746890 [compost metagenome]